MIGFLNLFLTPCRQNNKPLPSPTYHRGAIVPVALDPLPSSKLGICLYSIPVPK